MSENKMNGGGLIPKLNKPHIPPTFLPKSTNHLTSLQCGSLLQSLTNAKSLSKGLQLHAHMIACGTMHHNTYINTKLAAFYAACGRMPLAQSIFDSVVLKNSFLWNCMIRGFACNGPSVKAVALYRQMIGFGRVGDSFTYTFVLKACRDSLLVETGRSVHGEVVVRGLESDLFVGNSLVALYAKFGSMGLARMVFDKMPHRDLTSWSTLISGYVKNGDPREAFLVFFLMGREGFSADCATVLGILSASAELGAGKLGKAVHGYVVRSGLVYLNSFITNSLIHMYSVCNCRVHARLIFEAAARKDTMSWNSMISGYARKGGDAFESLRLFCRMVLSGEGPDEVTLVTVLGACDQIGALQFGTSVHSYIVKKRFDSDTMVGTALVNMYSICGSLDSSIKVFSDMPSKNLVSWSVMIAGYGSHGMGRAAISCFREMLGSRISPDEGVFTSVLSACSHARMVDEGKGIFYEMTTEHNVKPSLAHFSCMVDLFGRAGHLAEAYKFIESMEVRPSSDVWAALLSACRLHRNLELAEISAWKVFEMNPERVGSYICLSNMYAAEKRWEDVEKIRSMARMKGLKKPPGCSFIELDKVIHRFLVGDRSHEQAEDIYAKVEDLRWQLKEAGYKPDTSSVFYDVKGIATR